LEYPTSPLLASEQLRQCCLPLEQFACIKEGLR
jgi:hypothetical protein